MKNLNKVISLVAGVLVLSACGSVSSSTSATGTTAANSTSAASTTTTTTTTTSNVNNLPAAGEDYIQLSGLNGGASSASLQFNTDRTLVVQISALSAPNFTLVGYTNWVEPYGCMSVNITVNGITRGSGVLQVPGVTQNNSECMNAPSSVMVDFSDVTTGDGPVTVTFSGAQYDNCRYTNPDAYGCALTAVWQNHQAAFNAAVQTDGTYLANSPEGE